MQYKTLCSKKPETDFDTSFIDIGRSQRKYYSQSPNYRSKRGMRDFSRRGNRNPPKRSRLPKPSENAWQRPDKYEADEFKKKRIEIYRLLNKVSFENFQDEEYIAKITRCCFSSLVYTELLIDSLYYKAIIESRFSVVYASLCSQLSSITPGYEVTKENSFKKLIIKRCQHEFENKKRPPPIPENLSPQEKLDLEETGNKIRAKNDGAVLFIGELYLRSLLSERVMFVCLRTLLTKQPEKSEQGDLENFCKLMTTIGKNLDVPKFHKPLNSIFDTISSLSKNKEITPRLRFIFLDLIDFRKRGWKPKNKITKKN